MKTPEEEAKRLVNKYGKEESLNIINLSISEMIRSYPIKRYAKEVKRQIKLL